MFRWASVSDYSAFVWIFLGLILIFVLRSFWSQKKLKAVYSQRLLSYYFGNLSLSSYGLWRMVFFVLGGIFVLIALLRPQYGSGKVELGAQGVELVFVVDVSQSMAAEDIKPQRLDLVKIQLKKLVEILDGNKMGLVAFSGQVGVISPLTQDIGALNLFIESLDFNIFSQQGTNINFALSEAEDLLNRGVGGGELFEKTEEDKNKKSQTTQQRRRRRETTQVIVLVTDGEDHSKGTLQKVADLKSRGLRTFVIAVGTSAGAKIPYKDSFGQTVGYVKGPDGKDVVTQPRFSFLKKLARKGEGGFYRLGFDNQANLALAKDFEKLKKSQFQTQSFEVKGEYFQIPLILGLMLLVLSGFCPQRTQLQKIRSLLDLDEEEEKS